MTSESGEHYYCDEGTDEDPTPVHRCNQNEDRGRWWGPDFCPHIGNPVIDGCYFCGRAIPNSATGEHNHTMYEKKGFRGATEDRYSCVCDAC